MYLPERIRSRKRYEYFEAFFQKWIPYLLYCGEGKSKEDMTPESIADNILRFVNDNNLRERIDATVKQEENTTYLTEVKKVERMLEL